MTKKKALALCVPIREAERVRRMLRDNHVLRDDVKIKKEASTIYFPISEITNSVSNYPVATKVFEVRIPIPHDYKDLLNLPKTLQEELPTSYDIIGSIILIKLPSHILQYHNQIGNALLKTHKNIRTVCVVDPVSGENRTRAVMIVAGENKTLTSHTEYGLTFQVDVATTYFSSRLASERKRVASLVKKGETVVDLFAGVAPFSIMIARFAEPKRVYAIDKNRAAIDLAYQNVRLNQVLETVEVIHADAKDAQQVLPTKADRIIMNLPFSAYHFFSVALSIAAPLCKVHYYDIIREENIDARISSLKDTAKTQGYTLADVAVHKIKSYAPREFYIGLDITATKHADVA